MSEYFDKDFFKFLLGFFVIIALSLIIILGTRTYQKNSQAGPTTSQSSTP